MKNNSRFLQKIIWVSHEKPTSYMILVEIDKDSEIPIGTSIIRVPERYLFAFRYHLILN